MELITRARTHLSLILVGSGYAKLKESFQQAAALGLVEIVQLGEGLKVLMKSISHTDETDLRCLV